MEGVQLLKYLAVIVLVGSMIMAIANGEPMPEPARVVMVWAKSQGFAHPGVQVSIYGAVIERRGFRKKITLERILKSVSIFDLQK
ncbi:unnamed protein product [Allacma fusca]|uniref:Uncharacterized protein n=1 Tax=Allacma fusca TaxID=39272 RepID=A0A8J2LXW5_9HEXA|nr:unnamed protein product [Allacma fusca]